MCTPQGIIEKVGCLVFDEAVKAAVERGKYLIDYKTNLKELEDEMKKLEGRKEIIEKEVHRAHDDGKLVYHAVTDWLENVKKMRCNVEDQGLVRQSSGAEKMRCDVEEQGLVRQSSGAGNMSCLKWSCPNIKQRYRLSKDAKDKIAPVRKLIEDSHFGENEISYARSMPSELEFGGNENYVKLETRAQDIKRIMDALKDPSVNIIGVHGIAGIGKTTLVKEVGKKMRQGGTFNQVTLATVSNKDLNVKDIQSQLADRLNFGLDAEDHKGRATKLWNKFINGDKYLVILDDIWEEVDIKAIGIPLINGSDTGCKVLLTFRNGDLLTRMKIDRSFTITRLEMPEAWTLFKDLTGNSIDESEPELYSLAREVCKKCNGLPVAINALGAGLKGKPNHAWKNALDNLERCMITNIEGISPNVWASLKLSYDMLRSSDARTCFLLCCLFPKDVETSIDDLARLCFTRCLLSQNPRTLEEARDAVRTLVDSLKSASLLSNDNIDETVVIIPDVIRDVGISIARKEEAFLIDHGAVRWPRNSINGPRYSAISLRTEKIRELPNELTCPQLHTLMFFNSKISILEVPGNFLDAMKQLTVLVLRRMRLQTLPRSLANMTTLGMLCLENCKLDDITILGDLKTSLEVLSLRGSNIKELPREIENLTNLLLLDLRDCKNLKVIPEGVISKLTSLEELYLPRTFDQWGGTEPKKQDTKIRNVTLEELRGPLSTGQLTTLHMHVPDVKLLPKESLNFENLKIFRISVGPMDNKRLRGLSSFLQFIRKRKFMGTRVFKCEASSLRKEFFPLVDKAESLYFKNIKDLKKVIHDRCARNRFLDLKYIEVVSCDDYLEYLIGEPKSIEPSHGLHPSKSFNNLIEVIIEKCKLKCLFFPSTARGLVHLKKLEVKSCEIMEEIVGFEGQNDEDDPTCAVEFSKLTQLLLTDLPNLTSFYAQKEKTQTTIESSSTRDQPLFNEKVIFPALERLTICKVSRITEIWDNHSIAGLEARGSFYQMMDVLVKGCHELMHVFRSKMHPLLKNLEKLEVRNCRTMKGVVRFEEDGLGNDQICFNKLVSLRLSNLPNLVSFSTDSAMVGTNNNEDATIHRQYSIFNEKVIFPELEGLIISRMGNIIEIWDKKSIAVLNKKGSFCKLTDMSVSFCDKLLLVFSSKMQPLLKNLKKLKVEGCAAMEGIVELEGEMDEDELRNEVCFSKLSRLDLRGLPKLVSFYTKLGRTETTDGNANAQSLFNEKVAIPVLERLDVVDLENITRIWDNQPFPESKKEAKSFCELMSMRVHKCVQLEYVLPFYMLPQLKNLRNLNISECTKMEVIISNNPKEKEATNNDTILFPQLKNVELEDLPNLKSLSTETQLFFSNKDVFPVLEEIDLDEGSEIFRDGTSMIEVSMKECGTSGKENGHNGEQG